jgi:hypothetical protein
MGKGQRKLKDIYFSFGPWTYFQLRLLAIVVWPLSPVVWVPLVVTIDLP